MFSSNLEKYQDILNRYRNGEFGNDHLTMYEILERAGESELFAKMDLSEIEVLINESSGLTKKMFLAIKKTKNTNTKLSCPMTKYRLNIVYSLSKLFFDNAIRQYNY